MMRALARGLGLPETQYTAKQLLPTTIGRTLARICTTAMDGQIWQLTFRPEAADPEEVAGRVVGIVSERDVVRHIQRADKDALEERVEAIVQRGRKLLFEARARRPKPDLDDKVIKSLTEAPPAAAK